MVTYTDAANVKEDHFGLGGPGPLRFEIGWRHAVDGFYDVFRGKLVRKHHSTMSWNFWGIKMF